MLGSTAAPPPSPHREPSSASFSGSFTSIDAPERDGKNPLRLTAEGGRRDVVKALQTAGASADARCGTDGGKALHAASRRDIPVGILDGDDVPPGPVHAPVPVDAAAPVSAPRPSQGNHFLPLSLKSTKGQHVDMQDLRG